MHIDPVAFSIGNLDVYWYGILISTGVLLGLLIAMRQARRYEISDELPLAFLFWALPLGLLGARLFYVVFNWSYYSQNPHLIFAFRQGGLAIHGAVLTGILVLAVFCRMKKINFWLMGDILAPSLILAQAIGRWGNYFNQEAYGVETDLPWAMFIDGAYRHPTFLYESIWNVLVFAALMILSAKRHHHGEILVKYFIYYSIGRFFVEGLRTDSLYLGPFRQAQVLSLIFIGGGAFLLKWLRRNQDEAPVKEGGR